MIRRAAEDLPALYEADETAWLDAMAGLIRGGQLDRLDYAHLAEYLEDMAARDRREVMRRLRTLLAHLLLWPYRPRNRSRRWRSKFIAQRHELAPDLRDGVLRKYAEEVLAEVYTDAVEQAAVETGLPAKTFPAVFPYTLDQLLSSDLPE